MRKLSDSFLKNLKDPNGILFPFLDRVKLDSTLMLAIREGYINIYYRGGSILRIDEDTENSYKVFFDYKYNKFGANIPALPSTVKSQQESIVWVRSFAILKETMDLFFGLNRKNEREFQQIVVRENNYSPISNETEYFISDIEFADSELGARFDLLAVKWEASRRKNTTYCKPVFIEMKYGDNSLEGNSGIVKHLKDFLDLISQKSRYKALLDSMSAQFNQLDEMGLLVFNHCKADSQVIFQEMQLPEVVFLFANHNPRSTILKSILTNPENDKYIKSDCFDLRFYISSFAGYAMHSANMFSIDQFIKWL